jgi:hypothetical protein
MFMLKEEGILELHAKVTSLEDELRRIQKSRKLWRRGTLLVAALCASVGLFAQTPQGPLTLQSLAQRVSDLEKRVTNDEASGTNIPQTADTGTTPGKPAAGSTENNTIEQRVTQLETSLTQVQSQVTSLEAGLGTTKGTPVISTVIAPFKVVDQAGHVVMTVGKSTGQNFNALDLYNPGGLPVTSLYAGAGFARIELSDSNDASVAMGILPGEHASLSVKERSAHATLSTNGGIKTMGLYLGSKEGADDVALDLEGGVGNLFLLSGQQRVGSFSVTKDGNGAQLQVDGSTGTAIIGAPSSKSFGLRLYPSGGTASPNAGIIEDGKDSVSIGVGQNGKWLASIEKKAGTGIIGVLDGAGQKYLSAITNYEGGGGALQISNSSGQIVSLVDANPTNNQGRAVFTDAGGEPMVKIGAAGSHGDVLLGGNGKGLDLWTHMLTGLP